MKLKMPLPNTLFRMGLLFMIIKVFLSMSHILEVPDYLDTILSVVASGFLVTSILQKRFPMKTLILFALIILTGLWTSLQTGNMMMFVAILTCLAMCGEDLNDGIRFMLYAESLLVLLVALLSVLMQLLGYNMFVRVSGEMRYGFGFSHPNVFSCILTNLFAMYLWLNFHTVRVRNLLAISVINIIVFLITNSRTGLIVTAFLVVFVWIYRHNEKPIKFMKYAAMYALPVMTVIFYVLCKAFVSGNVLVRLIDWGLSQRIRLSAYALDRFGVSFFGQNLSSVEVKWDEFWQLSSIAFDNVYTYLLVTQFVWLLVFIFLFYRVAKKGDAKYCIFILAWALYGISEIHVINPFLFFTVLIVTSLFGADEESETDAEEDE